MVSFAVLGVFFFVWIGLFFMEKLLYLYGLDYFLWKSYHVLHTYAKCRHGYRKQVERDRERLDLDEGPKFHSNLLQSHSCSIVTGKYKRRFVTCAQEDRISNLPEHLIDSILERVPFEYAVRTSSISKNWRYRWTTLKTMVLDHQFANKFVKNGAFGRNGFIRIINQILILHEGSISNFQLHLPNMFLDSFQEVDQWMILLSRKGVRELTFTSSDKCYKLPRYFFSCVQLTKLVLENCFFKPPLEFEGFLNLERVALTKIDFGDNLCGTWINLPQLKKLFLVRCTHVYNFSIKAAKLQYLMVFNCPDANFFRLFNSPCLTEVGLYFHEPVKEGVRLEKMTLAMMLTNLPKVEHLYVDDLFFKVLSVEKIPKWLPHAVNSLKGLYLQKFQPGDLDQLQGALCLLRNAPNLESLYVTSEEMKSQVIGYDVGAASDHLEAPNCLDCTLNRLQTVEIKSLEGSRLELLFIKLLLAHSPSLKKLTVRPTGISDAQKILDVVMAIKQFPRASPKTTMLFTNR